MKSVCSSCSARADNLKSKRCKVGGFRAPDSGKELSIINVKSRSKLTRHHKTKSLSHHQSSPSSNLTRHETWIHGVHGVWPLPHLGCDAQRRWHQAGPAAMASTVQTTGKRSGHTVHRARRMNSAVQLLITSYVIVYHYHVILYHNILISCYIISYHIISYHIISYHMLIIAL